MNIAKIFQEMKDPVHLMLRINYRYPQFCKWMDDETCVKFWYRISIGKKLNLKNPKTFNEKLQWLKLYDRKREYTLMVDKYEAKKYVAERIGEQYIIPTLGVWDKFEDIDFDVLPKQFVLKCTHDSGGLVICKDKSKLDIEKARKKINRSLKRNFYWVGREWPYKNVEPRIIAEAYIEDKEAGRQRGSLRDYKMHVFNGSLKFTLVCSERGSQGGLKEDFYDVNWQKLDLKRPAHENSQVLTRCPENYTLMKKLAEKLAKDCKFLRVDFYETNGKVYFGELTFYPASGFEGFIPREYDNILGEWMEL